MKIKCDFCKTEYNPARTPTSSVKCAICGRVWTPAAPARTRATLTFIAALCALLSAVIFAVAVIARHKVDNANHAALVAEIADVQTHKDDDGIPHFVVTGRVKNTSDDIYGVPDIIVVSRDANGNPVAAQRVMPPATLLDAGGVVEFTETLTAPTMGVKKITIEMQYQGADKK